MAFTYKSSISYFSFFFHIFLFFLLCCPFFIHLFNLASRGRILERNHNKSLKNFSPCYSQSPLLTDFTPPPLIKSILKLVCNVNILYGDLKSENVQKFGFWLPNFILSLWIILYIFFLFFTGIFFCLNETLTLLR